MAHSPTLIKKQIITVILFVFVVSVFGVALFARDARAVDGAAAGPEIAGAQAEAVCHAAPFSPPCAGASIKETARVIKDRVVTPSFQTALVQGLLNISQFVVNRLAYESALIVANGGPGQGSLFYGKSAIEGFKEFGLEAAGEAVAELSSSLNTALGTNFDLCLPAGPGFTLSLQLGIVQKYKPQKPRCDILEVARGWQSFVSDAASTISDPDKLNKAVISKFAESLAPGRNELSAAIKLNIEVSQAVRDKNEAEIRERTSDKPAVKEVKDPITGKTKTPAKVVENDFLDKIKKAVTGETTQLKAEDVATFGDAMGGLALTAASTFTNTLLSQLFNKIYSGLFDTSADKQDPFDVEAVAQTGQDPQTFSRLFAATPFATSDYNALSEFVVCPPQGIANRGINNCVIDSNFLAAVSRGNSGVPLTLQEAMSEPEGLINGNLPLISSKDLSSNQDPLCYTYGFCYSNLVKLRKARVIPIGWELAAERNSEKKTLQEIANQFENCNEFGAIDGSHPFCHLVDPNWVLKYPDTQCRATVNGEIRLTQFSTGRQSVCADAPSCLGENSKGECTDGFGYCVREKNVWRFRGDECPAQYAGCLALSSTTDNKQANVLINTVDFSVCGQQNAGCQWYRTNQSKDTAGTADPSDDTYKWLLPNETYDTVAREDDNKLQIANGAVSARVAYAGAPARYAYEDRIYFNRNAGSCSESDAGCSEVIEASGAVLNMVRNPSFEQDEDNDGVPDGWTLEGGLLSNQITLVGDQPAARGSVSLRFPNGIAGRLVQVIPAKANQFYTLSFFGLKEVPPNATARVSVSLFDAQGGSVPLAGSSVSSSCTTLGGTINSSLNLNADDVNTWKRGGCTFSTPALTAQMRVDIIAPTASARYDAFQLEPRETASTFVEGLAGTTNVKNNVKIAPDYLGCTGAPTDSPLCVNYAQMCQAQDVGCSLFTPSDGDPSIPAIANALDSCPAECVGYDTYKQEKTTYESEKFPLFFIPTQAAACSAQSVGCDGFTNLSLAGEGGEGVEHYTRLRACVTPGMTSANDNTKQSATFFTWEGSDNAGYQLRSWNLLESEMGDDTTMVEAVPNTASAETHIGKAPCTKWSVSGRDTLVCQDSSAGHIAKVGNNPACNDHADIFTNPDCREFFDAEGFVHYREFSKTVTVSDRCQPYRKNNSTAPDCNASGGFWDAEVGFCRYFGLASESASCPVAANGCRAYTGGAGRNAATLLSETFEAGTTAGYQSWPNAGHSQLIISNESVATDGHSLRVTAQQGRQAKSGVRTLHAFINGQNANIKYDATSDITKAATCFGEGRRSTQAGCEIDIDNNNTTDCIAGPGEHSCGTLVNKLVAGKTFTVEFWAKGSGNLFVGFEKDGGNGTERDLVNLQNNGDNFTTFAPIPLSGAWKVYSLGPFDSSTMAGFNKDTVLFFITVLNDNFFIDNLVVKQVEENITIIKDSWVVPSTCDMAPNGVESPQYYLGCEAYTDQKGAGRNLYQFSNLCSEKVVGCEMAFQTFQSDSPYEQVNNARCAKNNGAVVASATACAISGKTYCTIAQGRSYCTFDVEGALPDVMPRDATYSVVYGSETVVVPADRPVYFVNDGSFDCAASSAGCREVGKPKFSQDLSRVESFESAYLLNDPDQYGDILCDNEALFCEEYASNKNVNYYFKNPNNKTCDYRASVDIDGKKYLGWFRTGTSEPCYWNDVNGDGRFDPNGESAYVVSGDQMAIWKNGDAQYRGWVGACAPQYDQCTEFIDMVDTEGGLKKDGTSYYFINNERLQPTQAASASDCKGQVSQKQGCALFNNRSVSDMKYNASATYILSTHADVFLNKAANAMVDPVSCIGDGGVFSVDGQNMDLCLRRCKYRHEIGDAVVSNMAQSQSEIDTLERSCFVNEDCPVIKSKNGKTLTGACLTWRDNFKLRNDSNTVLKVARDRSCSAWLACDSSRTSFNERNNKYEPICDSIDLCVKGGQIGQSAACTDWDPRSPEILTDQLYSKRDVTWNGYELSGFAIPNQLPVELYDQFNLNPEKVCVQSNGEYKKNGQGAPIACDADNDCGANHKCASISEQRLVYNAGACDSSDGNGEQCFVGRCSNDSDRSCFKQNDCGVGNQCVVGYCQQATEKNCATDADCSNGFFCDPLHRVCVDVPAGTVPCTINSGEPTCANRGQSCTVDATTAKGACFNNRCLTDIKDNDGNGFADPIKLTDALEQSCRGYPEVDAPYPSAVVTEWVTPSSFALIDNQWREEVGVVGAVVKVKGTSISSEPRDILSQAYSFKQGYDASNVCGKDKNGNDIDCQCTYDKVSYGKGARALFTAPNTNANDVPAGLCLGGPFEGTPCQSDKNCTDASDPLNPDAGSCLKKTAQDTQIGWHGYCIEKDSSIPLYNSTEPEDRACLTWLPVDQLTGATDLYAKYTSAGYSGEQTRYCADIEPVYDIKTTAVGCGENFSGACGWDHGDGVRNAKDDFNEDKPGIFCPQGFFAIAAMCDDLSETGHTIANSSDGDCEEGDNDYPFFCVPYNSQKLVNNIWEACKRTEVGDGISFVGSTPNGNSEVDVTVQGNTFENLYNKYKDCVVKGVTLDHVPEYLPVPVPLLTVQNPSQFRTNSPFGTYYGLKYNYDQYTSCKTLVETSTNVPQSIGTNLSGYNVAWTDRVWKDRGAQGYTIKPDGSLFSYPYNTAPVAPFGQAKSSGDLENWMTDQYPHRLTMCVDDFQRARTLNVMECTQADRDAGFVRVDGDARGFYQVSLNRTGFNPADETLCKDDECVCNSELKSDLECNWYKDPDIANDPGHLITCGAQVCSNDEDVSCSLRSDCGEGSGRDCNLAHGDLASIVFCQPGERCVGEEDEDGVVRGKCNRDCITEDVNAITTCIGGPKNGQRCENNVFCQPNQCYQGSCVSREINPDASPLTVEAQPIQKAKSRLGQLFARSLSLVRFEDQVADPASDAPAKGRFSNPAPLNRDDTWFWDVRKQGDGIVQPIPPKVISLGACTGTRCREGRENAITVNDQDEGEVFGKGSKRVTLSFFVKADSNQMPVRRIVADWGDGRGPTPAAWPTDSQSGSTAPDNFYKNHRGLGSTGQEICRADAYNFGEAPQACSSSYVVFSHDYTCTAGNVASLSSQGDDCGTAQDGRLLTSPCTDGKVCKFQPRVHVLDNWGWCTGFCNAGDDGTNGCFSGTPPDDNNECRIEYCPSKALPTDAGSQQCPDANNPGKTVNPWINYDGFVVVEPEE